MMDPMTVDDLAARRETRQARRNELGAFLKTRRARISPADVGLPPGPRRRTPGLRREEVAQLSGIGITWYTWLEQGRAGNVSVQVLDAVARTLRLDQAEHAHLYRLAGVLSAPGWPAEETLPNEVHAILEQLVPFPACVLGPKYDLLAFNVAYSDIYPTLLASPERNILRDAFVTPACCKACHLSAEDRARMVGYLRSAYGKHLNDPGWASFIRELSTASEEFNQLWARNDVAVPGTRTRTLRSFTAGSLEMQLTNLTLPAVSGAWVQVFTPVDTETSKRMAMLRAMTDAARLAPWIEHRSQFHPVAASH